MSPEFIYQAILDHIKFENTLLTALAIVWTITGLADVIISYRGYQFFKTILNKDLSEARTT